ncbi:MAG: DHH family phosphoesterase [Candidatus Hodarchaeota archaeon]
MIVSITHELDLDGLGSQAIIKRYFDHSLNINKRKIILHYAHYSNFIGKIREILNAEQLPDQLIISDIGFNDDFKTLFSLFEQSKLKSIKILWFDHHLIDENYKDDLEKLLEVYLNDPNRCSAEIVKDYYLPNDSIANIIAKFSRDIDFHTKIYLTASNLQSIIAFNRESESDEIKRKIVDLLSIGKLDDNWFDEQLVKIKEWEKEQTQFALDHIIVIDIDDFGKILISFAKLGGGKIVSILKSQFSEIKVYLGIDIRYNEIIIHSDYVNCREFARKFKGGGHRNRAGFKFDNIFTKNYEINQDFVQQIKISIQKFKIN